SRVHCHDVAHTRRTTQYRHGFATRLVIVAASTARTARARNRSRRLVHLATLVAFAERGALVVQLLAAPQAELDLGAAVLKVEPERNERQPALSDLAGQPANLLAVQQQLAVAVRLVVGIGAVAVGIDVAADQPTLTVADGRVRVLEGHAPVAQRLDLRPAQHEPGLDRLEDLVLVPRPAVGGNRPIAGALDLTGHPCWVL